MTLTRQDEAIAAAVTFRGVFAQLSSIAATRPRAHDALRRLLTFDDHVAVEHGIAGLADFDRELFVHLEEAPEVRLLPEQLAEQPSAGDSKRVVDVFWNTLGRVYLRPHGETPADPAPLAYHPLGSIVVPGALFEDAAAAAKIAIAEENAERARLDALLDHAVAGGTLDAILESVADAVRHVEAVCFYIDDSVYAAMERVQTLVHGPSVLLRLREQPSPGRWSPAERLLVIALHSLFLSGKSVRFEEFNGAALTARALVSRLRELGRAYTQHEVVIDRDESDLFAYADAIGRAARNVAGLPFLRYRFVSGWTFRKTEHCTGAVARSNAHTVFSPRLDALAERWLGRSFDGSIAAAEEIAEAVVAATEAGAGVPDADPATTPVEEWIQEIVVSAVHVTDSDYGMSSSIRRVGPLAQATPDELLPLVLALKPPDFFTCITSRPGLAQLLGPSINQNVYRAVKARMQFNRWHFICGNFPCTQIPASRHWFYPPVLPDLAQWSDVWHDGHIKAGVRYSVRTPGPDMSVAPLLIGGHPFRGFYDVRVVRIGGEPFTLHDLLVTRQHCLWMGALWRRLVAASTVDIVGFATGAGFEPGGRSGNPT